jgi:uracil-DNA glycosylase
MAMTPAERMATFRALATGLAGVDLAVYAAAGLDPVEPVVGEGDRRCRVAIIGRDPGRNEILERLPFIGVGGAKVRRGLFRALYGAESAGHADLVLAGRHAFWLNTVPYKPIGNAAWPEPVRRAFQPALTDLLVHGWDGEDVLAFGKEALFWFARDVASKAALEAHWSSPDGFSRALELDLRAPDGVARRLRVHPLPHPSPLNARWAPHVARLIDEALARIGFDAARWHLDGAAPSASPR